MSRNPNDERRRKSIFRSLFVPLFLIMILQAAIFYFAAVYGGIEDSLNQNAADILSERLTNRKNEIEARFNNRWTNLEDCSRALELQYADYERSYGKQSLAKDDQLQIQFLKDSAAQLISTLRHNEVNGIFLILNDHTAPTEFMEGGTEQKYGLCIRDMDQESNYSGREDLLLERAPSSLVDVLECPLDSWWEARYRFQSLEEGDYYYYPLYAAWENAGAAGKDLAYCSDVHQISGSDQAVLSYSIPLLSEEGEPFAVLGVELSVNYIASLLPNEELNQADKCCYVLARQNTGETDCVPLVATGALYNRCFGDGAVISCGNTTNTGGFSLIGRDETQLYGASSQLDIYNNNNPFEAQQLTLLAMVESDTLFAYIERVKGTLGFTSLISLLLGIAGILFVSRRFASPITALAGRVRGMKSHAGFRLGRLGITEIDQLVDSIEELNRNVSRDSARTEFFSRMSHDMRTPMNAIISFSSPELLEGASPATKDEYLNQIHSSGRYLLGLINEVLDMTKIESNKTDLSLDTLQASRLFETTISIIKELAKKKGVYFSEEILVVPDLFVVADGQHLNQIVMNLLSNGVKFTPPGGVVKLSVEMEAAGPEQILCRIIVADTGVGMSEAFMANLYTPFEQENRVQEGTGLGLSIAKKLVDLMEGSIECSSRKGQGTSFTVKIPLMKGRAESARDDSVAEEAGSPDFTVLQGKQVLVCEDNSINGRIICNLLSKAGISARMAVDGREGVDAFAEAEAGTFDAILMDIQMPVMDGLAAAREIRALPRPDAATIPILAMTANAFAEDVHASEEAGMNAHLTKPVEPQKLFGTLARLLE